MSDCPNPNSDGEYVQAPELCPATRQALVTAAQRNGRTIHEEAAHIIKAHLATCGEDED